MQSLKQYHESTVQGIVVVFNERVWNPFFSSLEKIFETHGGRKSVAVCTISQLRQGTKALKASQVYPRGYGKEVARLHLSYIVARIQHDDDMGNNNVLVGKLLSWSWLGFYPPLGKEQRSSPRMRGKTFPKGAFTERVAETLSSSFLAKTPVAVASPKQLWCLISF